MLSPNTGPPDCIISIKLQKHKHSVIFFKIFGKLNLDFNFYLKDVIFDKSFHTRFFVNKIFKRNYGD